MLAESGNRYVNTRPPRAIISFRTDGTTNLILRVIWIPAVQYIDIATITKIILFIFHFIIA
jgi:hypothetical protein